MYFMIFFYLCKETAPMFVFYYPPISSGKKQQALNIRMHRLGVSDYHPSLLGTYLCLGENPSTTYHGWAAGLLVIMGGRINLWKIIGVCMILWL